MLGNYYLIVAGFVTGDDTESAMKCSPSSCSHPLAFNRPLPVPFALCLKAQVVVNTFSPLGRSILGTGLNTLYFSNCSNSALISFSIQTRLPTSLLACSSVLSVC